MNASGLRVAAPGRIATAAIRRYRRLAVAVASLSACLVGATAFPSPAMADMSTARLVICSAVPGSMYASVTGNPASSGYSQVTWYYALSTSWDYQGNTYSMHRHGRSRWLGVMGP